MTGPSPNFRGASTSGRTARWAVLAVASLLVLTSFGAVLTVSGQVTPEGYIVLSDSLPIGPDLDATFHAVVPEGAGVLSAKLDLFGRRGTVPVSTTTSEAGEHTHDVGSAGLHTHSLASDGEHTHYVAESGSHVHDVFVYSTGFDLEDAKMCATLPDHTHTYDDMANIIYPYDMDPVESNGHTHVAPPHEHSCLISNSGEHDHTADANGSHSHDVLVSGDHTHTADANGTHSHDLSPGWSWAEDGSRPSNVLVTVSAGTSTKTLTSSYGTASEDWWESVDVTDEVTAGTMGFTLTSDTNGTIEYLLTVELDAPYASLSGHAPLGPDAPVSVPLWAPSGTTRATAYLFGSDLPMPVSMTQPGGEHTHELLEAGEHTHSVSAAGNHTHLVTGGEHEHEASVSEASPSTTSTTPTWDLPAHKHTLSWSGGYLNGVGSYSHGTVESEDHTHTVVGHAHTVTITDSGAHTHNLSSAGLHTHTVVEGGEHTHQATEAGLHHHALAFSPSTTSTGGPTGVTATLSGVDLTSGNGGPWALGAAPVQVELEPASWDDVNMLNLTADSVGLVEWVVVVPLDEPAMLYSTGGLAGTLVGHVRLPAHTESASVGVLATPYVMPMSPSTAEGGLHVHVSTADGAHSHVCQEAGEHTHYLAPATHNHDLKLNGTVIEVNEATGTVDLVEHTHTVGIGSPFSGSSSITGVTGSHSHTTEPHDHEVVWESDGSHTHVADYSGDHVHILEANGSHTHEMTGGEHAHALLPGAHTEAGYPSPAAVELRVGPGDEGTQFSGVGDSWWDARVLDRELVIGGSLRELNATSDSTGTVIIVLMADLDTEPPELTLVSAPEWVAPGSAFNVTVAVPDDIDNASASLELGPAELVAVVHDVEGGKLVFVCTVPSGAEEGKYLLNVTAADMVGNIARETLGTVGIDGKAPEVGIEIGSPKVVGDGFMWVARRTPVDFTIEDDTSGPDRVEYAFNDSGPWSTWDQVDRRILQERDEGRFDLYFRAWDVAGNVGNTMGYPLRIDDTPPNVTVVVAPSEAPSQNVREAGPSSVISMHMDDGDGVGALQIQYQVDNGIDEPEWRVYDAPLLVSHLAPAPSVGSFEMMVQGVDLLGNGGIAGDNLLTVEVDRVAPVPSPSGDWFLPGYVNSTTASVSGRVPGDVALLHYRVDTGDSGSLSVTPDETFSVDLELEIGENVLLYALEDGKGNTSPWVIAGTLLVDMVAPGLVAFVPTDGSEILAGTEEVSIFFNEPVTITSATARADGKAIEVEALSRGDGSAHILRFLDELPGGSKLQINVSYEAPGGSGSDSWVYTVVEKGEDASSGFVYGIIAGLLVGIIVAFFVLSSRRPGRERPVGEFDARPDAGIISPESDMEWAGDEEEDEVEEEADEVEEEADELEEEADELEEEADELEEEADELEEEADELEEEAEETEEEAIPKEDIEYGSDEIEEPPAGEEEAGPGDDWVLDGEDGEPEEDLGEEPEGEVEAEAEVDAAEEEPAEESSDEEALEGEVEAEEEDELEDEIDRLLEETGLDDGDEGDGDGEGEVSDGEEADDEENTRWRHDPHDGDAMEMPDPEEQTVDPGARF